MPTKIKVLLLFLTAIPLSAQSVFYMEPRAAAVVVNGTPDIGDLGRKSSDNLPQGAFTLALGYEVNPRVSVELRYTDLGDIKVMKYSPNWQIFPDGEVLLPVVRDYEYAQSTKIYSIAVPIRLTQHGAWSFRLAPLLHTEEWDVTLTDVIPIQPALPDALTLPHRVLITQRSGTDVGLGAEFSAQYELNKHSFVVLHYTYSALANLDAHQFGAGFGVRF